MYLEYLSGKKTQKEIAAEVGVDVRTITNWFKPYRENEALPKYVDCRDKIILADGYVYGFGATLLVVELTTNIPVTWMFTYSENYLTWFETFKSIKDTPFAGVFDGQKGMIKALRYRWPNIIIQRCQFHIIMRVGQLLTKNPEHEASIEFKVLVKQIAQVKTREDLGYWLYNFKLWHQSYSTFLNEKTVHTSLTPTGRNKWSYTHAKLHQAYSHVKNALPFLFQYLNHPEIPNTTGRIEGLNSHLEKQLGFHYGISLSTKRQLISYYLSKKQR